MNDTALGLLEDCGGIQPMGLLGTNHTILGLDIGIASIGWALYNQDKQKMIDMGVRIFEEATPAKESRDHRSARRSLRHKKWRKRQLLHAFVDFGFINYDDVFFMDGKKECLKEEYLNFALNHEIKDETVYHLRKRALNEQVTTRELVLSLYNICKTRGHFLLETVNYEKESITFDIFADKFYGLVGSFVTFNELKEEFENKILEPLFKKNIGANDIKKLIKNNSYTDGEESDAALTEICLLIRNNKADLDKIDPSIQLKDNSKKLSIDDLLRKDELNDFLEGIIELYDLINVSIILKKFNYICEKDVDLLENVKAVYHKKDIGDAEFNNLKNELQKKMTKVPPKKADRIRAIKNIENKFPNGLYVKEAKAILKKQKEWDSRITDEFIEICCDIIKSRIPYYIGPLGKDATNGWADLKGNFKYSYTYSKNSAVDEASSIEEWKKRMISHCTYLPDEFALPKGSFIAETFSIINEMNNLNCVDLNENDYYLTTQDKYKIFDELFLKENRIITYKELASLLNLKKVGTKNKGSVQKFKNKYTLYYQITELLPELKVKSITELFSDRQKIDKIEKIILDINLFDEEDSKFVHFEKEGFETDKARKLSKMKSKSFFSFSSKFICDTVINKEGKSLMEELFENNKAGYRNEQMTLITNATDISGNPINFTSNKYEEKLKNGEALGINLLIDNGKPVIPISRGVIRSLNECLKLYNSVIDLYGVPSRIVIETARDLKDSSQTGEIPARHYNKMETCYNDIQKQMSERKEEFKFRHLLEPWDKICIYLEKNKKKIELYLRQNGRDMISGEKIDIDRLQDYEMDHILPRGFGDNSMDNMMLINKTYNTLKNNRVPLMYIRDGAYTIKDNELITESSYEQRVTELFKLGLISENKVQRLLLKNTDEVEGFINRNLVDTRYIIREFMSILNANNKVYGYETHISALKSAYTDTYKKAFNIRKNRDIGVQHHALDAATLVLADQILSHYYPNYDQRGNFKAYQEMIKKMNSTEKNDTAKLNNWISNMYRKTFNHDMNEIDSLLNEIKNITPLYSQKVEKNFTGAFFDATIYPQEKYDKKGVLALIGVNDDKKVFSSINCVAVDFYKYTDKKGNKKHVGIHIPKVIVDKHGKINKEKYMTLIKDYYRVPELIDENGELRTYLFKIRVYKNDLIYDTKFNEIQKFNIGSIVNKKLEMKHIYDFAYNDIYGEFYDVRNNLIDEFNIKSYRNKDKNAVTFDKVDKKELISYSMDNLMYIMDRKRYDKAIKAILNEQTTLDEFIEKMNYLNLVVNRECTPPTIVGQYMPVANNPGFDNDSQYIKLKYSPLGIRYVHNEKGKLIIAGPHYHEYAVSKIKKEEFSWTICQEMI